MVSYPLQQCCYSGAKIVFFQRETKRKDGIFIAKIRIDNCASKQHSDIVTVQKLTYMSCKANIYARCNMHAHFALIYRTPCAKPVHTLCIQYAQALKN